MASWRLRDGAMVITRLGRDEFVDSKRWSYQAVPEEYAAWLRMIGMQIRQDRIPREVFERLHNEGYVVKDENSVDPHFSATLRSLDREFLWLAPPYPKELYEFILKLHSTRRVFSTDLIQGPSLPETTLRRALMLKQRHPEQEILLLGDDDLVSLPLAYLGSEVTVIDLHEDLLEFLDARAAESGLTIRTIFHDIRKALPSELRGRFSAVLTDPLSQETWLRIWLLRSASALRREGMIYLAIYARFEGTIRHLLNEIGLSEVDMWRSYSHYYNEYLHYVSSWDSSLFVIQASASCFAAAERLPDLDVDLKQFPAFLSKEYIFDFFECHPEDRPWPECMAEVQSEFHRLAKGRVLESSLGEHAGRWSLHLASSDMIVQVVAYPERAYVGLNVRGREEASDDEWVSLISKIFRPHAFYDAELERIVDYPD